MEDFLDGDWVRHLFTIIIEEKTMFDALINLIEKEGGISLLKDIFTDLESLIENFKYNLVTDASAKNALIDSIIAILQKQKS
jgi:hypothetical protein